MRSAVQSTHQCITAGSYTIENPGTSRVLHSLSPSAPLGRLSWASVKKLFFEPHDILHGRRGGNAAHSGRIQAVWSDSALTHKLESSPIPL